MELGAAARDRVKFINLDIRSFDQIEEVKSEILRDHGGLDILVNNASIYQAPDYQGSSCLLHFIEPGLNHCIAFYSTLGTLDFNPLIISMKKV